jgi:WD40 repeat protein
VLVVGGKDTKLRVFEVSTGNLLHTLSCHRANICSLCNHGSLVSSGGDNNCNSLITWDVKTWTVKNKVQIHSAAVTCIVDLQDGSHLASAGYDKKINIFNYKKGAAILSAINKTGIGCMTLSGDRERIITSALDNSIAVWYLTR